MNCGHISIFMNMIINLIILFKLRPKTGFNYGLALWIVNVINIYIYGYIFINLHFKMPFRKKASDI